MNSFLALAFTSQRDNQTSDRLVDSPTVRQLERQKDRQTDRQTGGESERQKDRVAGMAQWWERSPSTNVARGRLPDPASYVGWVCYWFSTLLREVFLRVLRFSPLLKYQLFQVTIRSCSGRTFLNEFLGTSWCSLGKQITFTFFYVSVTNTKACATLVTEHNFSGYVLFNLVLYFM